MQPPAEGRRRVAILLSTFDGAAFLREQLDSFLAQSLADWTLHWRDDGSRDGTPAIMRQFVGGPGLGRCVEHRGAPGNIGVLASYMGLLRAALPSLQDGDAIAFADQDDVWLPEKLARGMEALAWQSGPVVYCARYVAVDAALAELGQSARLSGPTDFPAALTQNVATGCTILLNQPGARLVADSAPPPGTLHDWWSYIVVTACGGRLLRDETPSVRYRQHDGNAVGVSASFARRAMAAARRGPRAFTTLLQDHVVALLGRPQALGDQARRDLATIDRALQGSRLRRLRLLRLGSFRRQTWYDTLALRLWCMMG